MSLSVQNAGLAPLCLVPTSSCRTFAGTAERHSRDCALTRRLLKMKNLREELTCNDALRDTMGNTLVAMAEAVQQQIFTIHTVDDGALD